MSKRDNRTTCPYCGYDFGTERALDEHAPCPENRTDVDTSKRTFD